MSFGAGTTAVVPVYWIMVPAAERRPNHVQSECRKNAISVLSTLEGAERSLVGFGAAGVVLVFAGRELLGYPRFDQIRGLISDVADHETQ